jgi:hypothetical protein
MNFFQPSRRLSAAVMSTLLMATLAGCGGGDGGGGSGSGTPPPTGNPDPNPPTMSHLTLTGTVTDAPIANAVVTASVGEETFTVDADANGNYSLEIEIEEDAADGFVTLSAQGVGSQSYVEFTSLAGTFSSLQAQAGDDDTLSNTENFATQITNVSTAQAVLLQEANDGQPITSAALLNSLSATLNGQEVLDLATAIKLVVDEPDNYPMPDDAASLLDLMSDGATRGQFVDATYDQDPTVFANTQTAIVTDTTLTQPVTNDSVPASLAAVMLSSASEFSFNYTDRVNSYTFNSDGTGTAATGQWGTEMSWSIQGSSIAVMYGATTQAKSYDYIMCNGVYGQHRATYASDGATLRLLSDRLLAITETHHITFDNLPVGCEQEPRDVTTTVARTIVNEDDFQQISAAELQGTVHTVYVYDEAAKVTADVAELNADGTGTTWAFGKQFTWEVDESGRTVTATFSDGTVGKYRELAQLDDVLSEITTPTGVRVDAGAVVHVDPESPLVFTPEALPGRFYLFGKGLEGADSDPRVKSFRLRFDADGTGSNEDDFIDENNELVTYDDGNTPFYAFHWHIDGEDAVVQRSFGNCAPGTLDCVIYDERHLVPLALIDSRVYWMEYRRFDDVDGVSESTVPTTLVRYYDYEPLDASAVVSSKAVVSAKASARKLRFRSPAQR